MPLLALFNNPVQNNSSYIWTSELYFVLLYQITHLRFDMKRIVYFDILNVIACFCVVCMHCNGWIHMFIHDNLWGATYWRTMTMN